MYKIKDKYLNHVMRYSMKSNLDLTGIYTKQDWNNNGFKDEILELVK